MAPIYRISVGFLLQNILNLVCRCLMLLYNPDFIQDIKRIIVQAGEKACIAINPAAVQAYWQMGKRIVEQEQSGKERADYGTQLIS